MASTTNPPTCADQKSKLADTERNIRNRIALEKQAFHIVENLIETDIKEEYLLEIGNLIGLSHYHDVIEERTIVQLCGYPLCDNPLKMIPKQKYHISSKSNKVYDITERKKFCSNQCFKASTFYENQISTSPIWARESEPKVEFKLLQSGRGFLGEEVIGAPEPTLTLKAQVEELLKLDSVGSRDKTTQKSNKNIEEVTERLERVDLNLNNSKQPELSESADKKCVNSSSVFKESESPEIKESESPKTKEDQSCEIKETKSSRFSQKPTESKSDYMMRLLDKRKNLLVKMADDKPLQITTNDNIPSFVSESLDLTPKNSENISRVKTSDKSKKEQNDNILEHDSNGTTLKESELSPLTFICTVIKQWITVKTKDFLMRRGENSDQRDEDFNYKYAALCQSLERKELEREKLEEGLMEELDESEARPRKTTKPLPDYKKIAKETKEFEIKVKQFYSGNFYTDKELEESEKGEDDEDESKVPIVMPSVDSHDQMLIRRRIVLERLNKVLPELLAPLKLSLQDTTGEIRQLVNTFSLTSSNILFKPVQWILVCLIIIKILAVRVPIISRSFTQPTTHHFLGIILNGLGHQLQDLDNLVANLLT